MLGKYMNIAAQQLNNFIPVYKKWYQKKGAGDSP